LTDIINPRYRSYDNPTVFDIFRYTFDDTQTLNISSIENQIKASTVVRCQVRYGKEEPFLQIPTGTYPVEVMYSPDFVQPGEQGYRNYFYLFVDLRRTVSTNWDAIIVSFNLNNSEKTVTLLNKRFNKPSPDSKLNLKTITQGDISKVFAHETVHIFASASGGTGHYEYNWSLIEIQGGIHRGNVLNTFRPQIADVGFLVLNLSSIRLNPSRKYRLAVRTYECIPKQNHDGTPFYDRTSSFIEKSVDLSIVDKMEISLITTDINQSGRGTVASVSSGVDSPIIVHGKFIDMVRDARVFLRFKACPACRTIQVEAANCRICGTALPPNWNMALLNEGETQVHDAGAERVLLSKIPKTVPLGEYMVVVEPYPLVRGFNTPIVPDRTNNSNLLEVLPPPQIRNAKLMYRGVALREYNPALDPDVYANATTNTVAETEPSFFLDIPIPGSIDARTVDAKISYGSTFHPGIGSVEVTAVRSAPRADLVRFQFALPLSYEEIAIVEIKISFTATGSSDVHTTDLKYSIHSVPAHHSPVLKAVVDGKVVEHSVTPDAVHGQTHMPFIADTKAFGSPLVLLKSEAVSIQGAGRHISFRIDNQRQSAVTVGYRVLCLFLIPPVGGNPENTVDLVNHRFITRLDGTLSHDLRILDITDYGQGLLLNPTWIGMKAQTDSGDLDGLELYGLTDHSGGIREKSLLKIGAGEQKDIKVAMDFSRLPDAYLNYDLLVYCEIFQARDILIAMQMHRGINPISFQGVPLHIKQQAKESLRQLISELAQTDQSHSFRIRHLLEEYVKQYLAWNPDSVADEAIQGGRIQLGSSRQMNPIFMTVFNATQASLPNDIGQDGYRFFFAVALAVLVNIGYKDRDVNNKINLDRIKQNLAHTSIPGLFTQKGARWLAGILLRDPNKFLR